MVSCPMKFNKTYVKNTPKDTIIHQIYSLDEELKQKAVTDTFAQHRYRILVISTIRKLHQL